MAFGTAVTQGILGSYDKTAGTFDISIDPKLWPALQAKSPILDMLERPSVDEVEFKWEVDKAPDRIYTAANIASGADLNATNTAMLFSAHAGLEVGSLIRNIDRATPIPGAGYFGQDEIMEITGFTGTYPNYTAVTVKRAVNGDGTNGYYVDASNCQKDGDRFEVLYAPKGEGSGPDINKYTDVVQVSNYVNNLDFYLTVTGDQMASKRLVAGDTLANQTQKMLTKMQNDLEAMFFYGVLASTPQGSNTVVRRTKGLDGFVAATGGNIDVTTKDVTPAALDGLMAEIMYDKSDPADRYIIACHPAQARKISAFGIDKVRLGQTETKYGRYIDTFKTDLGVDLPVIWSLNIARSDLFIIDMNKVMLPVFRPWAKAEWTYGDDGVDAWRQRYLGSFGVKVVDPLISHAKLAQLAW